MYPQHAEPFGLSWPGKAAAAAAAATPPTSRLAGDEAYDGEATHTFIAGDNLEAMKLLLPEYEGRVQLICTDPPYNTGSSRFIYRDGFGGGPAAGHTAWLAMMLPRLMLARRLLAEDGVLFITIGDDEVHYLGLLLNEVFGEAAFVATFLWRRRKTQANLSRLVAPVHDYILCYAKDKKKLRFNRVGYSEAYIRKAFANPDNDPRGPYQTRPLAQPDNASNRTYTLTMPDGRELSARWSCAPATFARYISEGRLYMPRNGAGMPRLKIYLSEMGGAIPNTWLDDVATYEEGSAEIEALFGSNAFFISPKPTALIRHLAGIGAGKEGIILDCFAGSGSTAHAIALMNEADGGARRSISIQLPEPTMPDSLPYSQGYKTIAHICAERIRRALSGINDARAEKGSAPVLMQSFRLEAG